MPAPNPHYRIGALEMQAKLDAAQIARLTAEINALRAAMLARLTILERLPASSSRDVLWSELDLTMTAIGDALYPESAKGEVDT